MARRGSGILVGVCVGGLPSTPTPREQPFATPEGVKFTAGGYGTEETDFNRGYNDPHISNAPEYDKVNYNERWTSPKRNATDEGNDPIMSDYEFRDKDRQTQGLFTRTPFERGR